MSNPASLAKIFGRSRDTIDHKLGTIKAYLETTGLGFRDKLVDNEGYPLPDVDHETILRERQRASRLLNDRKRVDYILELLAKAQYSTAESDGEVMSDIVKHRPFAVVDEVHMDSPADAAKLLNADFLLQFGTATQVGDVPKQIVEGTPVPVTVLRIDRYGSNVLTLEITPAKWSGNGLVGAHLVPLG